MSYDSQQPFSVCGTCAGRHRTSDCTNHDKPRCISCRVDGHASWDRRCPIFLDKCCEMDARMTENQMPYYPTSDPWTHVLRPPKAVPTPGPVQPQPRTQPGATGAGQAAAGGQQRTHRQATLNFPPIQPRRTVPGQSDGPDATPPSATQGILPARDALGTPTGHVKPWGDDMENENDDPLPPHLA